MERRVVDLFKFVLFLPLVLLPGHFPTAMAAMSKSFLMEVEDEVVPEHGVTLTHCHIPALEANPRSCARTIPFRTDFPGWRFCTRTPGGMMVHLPRGGGGANKRRRGDANGARRRDGRRDTGKKKAGGAEEAPLRESARAPRGDSRRARRRRQDSRRKRARAERRKKMVKEVDPPVEEEEEKGNSKNPAQSLPEEKPPSAGISSSATENNNPSASSLGDCAASPSRSPANNNPPNPPPASLTDSVGIPAAAADALKPSEASTATAAPPPTGTISCCKCDFVVSLRAPGAALALTNHLLEKHQERIYVCPECPGAGAYYYLPGTLRRHLLSRHKGRVDLENELQSQVHFSPYVLSRCLTLYSIIPNGAAGCFLEHRELP